MVKTVVSVDLPVDEKLLIKKQVLCPKDMNSENPKGSRKKFSIVTGIHGDELEGQLICFEVQKRINEHPEFLDGIVEIYPALNPLGIDSISRTTPHASDTVCMYRTKYPRRLPKSSRINPSH